MVSKGGRVDNHIMRIYIHACYVNIIHIWHTFQVICREECTHIDIIQSQSPPFLLLFAGFIRLYNELWLFSPPIPPPMPIPLPLVLLNVSLSCFTVFLLYVTPWAYLELIAPEDTSVTIPLKNVPSFPPTRQHLIANSPSRRDGASWTPPSSTMQHWEVQCCADLLQVSTM